MEILIIGGILVALMVYTSTRIKKSVAQAFEEETIETDDFYIVKPAGFLHPLGSDSEFAFEAYSKEFGEDRTKKMRQSLVSLKIFPNAELAAVCKNARQSFDRILSEEKPDKNTSLLKGEKREDDIETEIYHKILKKDRRVFDLQISVLADFQNDFEERAVKLLESFRVK